jgi:hypothetical protein
MATAALEFVNVVTVRQELDPDTKCWVRVDPPRVELQVCTTTGRVRSIPLRDAELARMLQSVSAIVAGKLSGEAGA